MNFAFTQTARGDRFTGSLKICSLLNSIFYFVNKVYIIENERTFHLIITHKGRIVSSTPYGTLRGAKIAFSKLFKHRGWKKNIKAEWSGFYEPDYNWVKKKLGSEWTN